MACLFPKFCYIAVYCANHSKNAQKCHGFAMFYLDFMLIMAINCHFTAPYEQALIVLLLCD